MKILVYGAGVIGTYLTHVLCKRKENKVTLLARGKWKKVLETQGLVIYHHLQRKTTIDYPAIIEKVNLKEHYDMVFAVMPYNHMSEILDELATIHTETLVLVGNNMNPVKMEEYIKKNSFQEKTVLFGFQVTGGQREKLRVVCERFGIGGLDIGKLRGVVDKNTKDKLKQVFQGTGFRLKWHENMEAFLICHPAPILPWCYAIYGLDGDWKNAKKADRELVIKAANEGYELLKALGYPIVPKGDDKFFSGGPSTWAMKFLIFISSKSNLGDLMMAAHCRHAVVEMKMLEDAWENLRKQKKDFEMPNWDKAKAMRSNWEELYRRQMEEWNSLKHE